MTIKIDKAKAEELRYALSTLPHVKLHPNGTTGIITDAGGDVQFSHDPKSDTVTFSRVDGKPLTDSDRKRLHADVHLLLGEPVGEQTGTPAQ